MGLARGLVCLLVGGLAAACSSDEPTEKSTQADAQAPLTVCDYGTKYPNATVIDPDNPVYEDQYYTQQEVIDSFAQAKQGNFPEYAAYLAARKYSDYLECAYCKCGCGGPSLGHQSAIDCFKDMHGFA